MNWTDIALMGFATWRIANMVANEKGPFYCFWRLKRSVRETQRHNATMRHFNLYGLLDCEYCNSVWIGTIIVALYLVIPHIVIIGCAALSLSTIAIFLKKSHEALSDIAKVMIRLSLKIQKS